MSLILNQETTKETINEFLKSMAFHSKYREIIGYVNSPEIVSTDFYSSPFASIIDSQATISSVASKSLCIVGMIMNMVTLNR